MIEHVTGNLLETEAEALVNTVNTVGVMGKGIALQFKQAYPENYEAYRKACEHGEVQPGKMFVFITGQLYPRYIINFPTKRHWKGKARIKDIESGLADLIDVVRRREIKSIAVPPLGCGNGGLRWSDVRPLIEAAFAELPGVRVLLHAPDGAPKAEQMRMATKRPNMTAGRAVLLTAFENYILPGYHLSMLEAQKLAYFLQVAGQPLKLQFDKQRYGPYAENLQHVMQRMEGHFIKGYGDRSQGAFTGTIRLMPEAVASAAAFLEHDTETLRRLEHVTRLIEGFEYPYGLELLATVHWVAQEDEAARQDVSAAIARVHEWSEHKRQKFSSEHIALAWERLRNGGWLGDVGSAGIKTESISTSDSYSSEHLFS
ncbi:MAG TPA: macro domain-containing protein [Pyrinomonadaceae bacterium]|nr:macro domain-containing protein [Pyrinomonadaceae bacterium]